MNITGFINTTNIYQTGARVLEIFRDPFATSARILYATARVIREAPQNFNQVSLKTIKIVNNTLKFTKLVANEQDEKKLAFASHCLDVLIGVPSFIHNLRSSKEAQTSLSRIYHTSMCLLSLVMTCANLYSIYQFTKDHE